MPTRIHLLLGVLAMAAAPASAQTKMFKCIVAGRTVYQQTECAAAAPDKEEAKPAARAASAPRRAASAASGAATAPGKTSGTRDPAQR